MKVEITAKIIASVLVGIFLGPVASVAITPVTGCGALPVMILLL